MQFRFEVQYKLAKDINVNADNLGDALQQAYKIIDSPEGQLDINENFLSGELNLILQDWLSGERLNPWITAYNEDKEVNVTMITVDSW